MVNFYLLRAFVTISQAGHLTRAADQLNLTQSALSKQLKNLESELGLSLFDRNQSGMKLTAAGRKLLPAALRVLQGAEELQGLAHTLQDSVVGHLRIGTIIDPDSIRLGLLLQELRRTYPQIEVQLFHGISGSVLRQVQLRELDACFYLGVLEENDCSATALCHERYLLAAPIGWQAEIAKVDWPELAAFPWIRTPPGSSQHRITADAFNQHGLVVHGVVEADQEASMLDLMKSGIGLCLMRERFSRQAAERGEFSLSEKIDIACPLSIIHLRHAAEEPVVQALVASLRKIWGSPA